MASPIHHHADTRISIKTILGEFSRYGGNCDRTNSEAYAEECRVVVVGLIVGKLAEPWGVHQRDEGVN